MTAWLSTIIIFLRYRKGFIILGILKKPGSIIIFATTARFHSSDYWLSVFMRLVDSPKTTDRTSAGAPTREQNFYCEKIDLLRLGIDVLGADIPVSLNWKLRSGIHCMSDRMSPLRLVSVCSPGIRSAFTAKLFPNGQHCTQPDLCPSSRALSYGALGFLIN